MTTTPGKPQTNALAIVSLVTGILGLVGVMPIIGSIAAIVAGRLARREITNAPDTYSGVQLARAGEVLGWLGVGLTLVVICFILLVLAFFGPVVGPIQ